MSRNPCCVGVYLGEVIADELEREALRTERTISWLMQRAWRVAREEIKSLPAAPPVRAPRGFT